MTERQEELIALHALKMLEPEEVRTFLGEIKYMPKAVELVTELQEVSAELAELITPEQPPEECRAQVMAAIARHQSAEKVVKIKTGTKTAISWVGWAVAACIAAGAFGLWTKEQQLQHRLDSISQQDGTVAQQIEALRADKTKLEQQVAQTDARAQAFATELAALKEVATVERMEVAALHSKKSTYEDSAVVIVWDGEKQEGKIKMEKIPHAAAAKDYQLWVIDKKQGQPVSAGVLKVDEQGNATMIFKPLEPVTQAAKFAISVEKQGGVVKKSEDGPIVFAGP